MPLLPLFVARVRVVADGVGAAALGKGAAAVTADIFVLRPQRLPYRRSGYRCRCRRSLIAQVRVSGDGVGAAGLGEGAAAGIADVLIRGRQAAAAQVIGAAGAGLIAQA